MGLKNTLKKVTSCSLIMMQLMSFMPSQAVFAATDDIPSQSPAIFSMQDEESLKAKIIQDPAFIKDLANLAHQMGLGWCGGTASQYVGDDFEFEKIGPNHYILKARYNENDPYASGYRAGERLEIDITNVKFYIDTDSLKLGKPKVTELKAANSTSKIIRNGGDCENTFVVDYSATEETSFTKTDGGQWAVTAGVKQTFTVKSSEVTGGVDSATELSVSATGGESWSEAKGTSTRVTQSSQERINVLPNKKAKVTTLAFQQKSDIPYTVNMYLDYDVQFKGFMRWKDNSRFGHDESRPTYDDIKFGGKPSYLGGTLGGPEDILDQYLHRDINGYSKWDWDWILDKYKDTTGYWSTKSVLSRITKKKYATTVSGKFTNIGGMHFDTLVEDLGELTDEDKGLPEISDAPASRERRSTDDDTPESNIEFNSMSVTPLTDSSQLKIIPQTEISASASSEETEQASNAASCAIDGNDDTIWHTKWDDDNTNPHSITLDLGDNYDVSQLNYLPRQDSEAYGGKNGRIIKYKIFASTDGVGFTKVAEGTWSDDYSEKIAHISSLNARYITLEAVESIGGFASAAEINVYSK
ncbi:aerolysin family beta-barrel pore-forming toxin [Tepidibacter aestuarii]|uniref:aerolysin family beta-barrel pore-forming toxin n=1 Tax=Tepidibacter aestuarii TaxID=2925782 RepID=UPI0020C0BCB4|nr:aerolysin family beta-barrel pore-forming toxin [Tepidibacter aestuarii]CAH2214934.1 putative Aerolysin family beta-barrel pore-forming toxin [Tepidibacter aestuarii]